MAKQRARPILYMMVRTGFSLTLSDKIPHFSGHFSDQIHAKPTLKFRYRRDLKRFTRLLTVNRRMVVCMRFLNSMFVWLFLLFFKNFTLILRNSLLFPDLDRPSPFSISFPDSEKAV